LFLLKQETNTVKNVDLTLQVIIMYKRKVKNKMFPYFLKFCPKHTMNMPS